jgi:GxxExxY protein
MTKSVKAFLDLEDEPSHERNRRGHAIIGAAIEVHRHLGPGPLKSAYEAALAVEFDLRGIRYQRQVEVELRYKGALVGRGRIDFLVEQAGIVDLKAISAITTADTKQMISSLRMTGHRLGIILSLNVAALRQGVQRIARRQRTARRVRPRIAVPL